jgi:FkbM family methyltransferase
VEVAGVKELHLKAFKLSLVALITLVFCLASLYLIDREQFYYNYRCWQQAITLSSCFGSGHFDFEVDLNGVRYQGNTGNFIDTNILYYGAYEKPTLFFLRDVMTSAYSNQGVFLDIGANTGQYSLFMSRQSKEVHAFEPWEPVIRRFRRMVEVNHIKNIIIHPFGLGDENSKKPFYKPSESSLVTGSFVEGFKEDNSYEGELEIQIGDDALEKAGVTSVALIKMDIEGYEKPALKGLRRTLHAHRPIVVFELSVDPKKPLSIKSKDELDSLFPQGYEFLVFSDKRIENASTGAYYLKPAVQALRYDTAEQYDVVAYPKEKKKNILLKGLQP